MRRPGPASVQPAPAQRSWVFWNVLQRLRSSGDAETIDLALSPASYRSSHRWSPLGPASALRFAVPRRSQQSQPCNLDNQAASTGLSRARCGALHPHGRRAPRGPAHRLAPGLGPGPGPSADAQGDAGEADGRRRGLCEPRRVRARAAATRRRHAHSLTARRHGRQTKITGSNGMQPTTLGEPPGSISRVRWCRRAR